MLEATIEGKTVRLEDSERTECEVWTRVMGYYRPIKDWNIGKKQEHRERRLFMVPTAIKRA